MLVYNVQTDIFTRKAFDGNEPFSPMNEEGPRDSVWSDDKLFTWNADTQDAVNKGAARFVDSRDYAEIEGFDRGVFFKNEENEMIICIKVSEPLEVDAETAILQAECNANA